MGIEDATVAKSWIMRHPGVEIATKRSHFNFFQLDGTNRRKPAFYL